MLVSVIVPASSSGASPVSQASTSSRGVTSTEINVVFPVVNLQALSTEIGFAGDVEYTEQGKAIDLFVKQINDAGGINGRTINPIITFFDPTSESDMRALCKDWTEGSPAAFAVLDGVGDWTGDDQLCITQEGHTPFLGQWTTISAWTTRAPPTSGGPAPTTPPSSRPRSPGVTAPACSVATARSGSSPGTGPATSSLSTTTCCPISRGSG